MSKCERKLQIAGGVLREVCSAESGCTKLYDENGKEVTVQCDWIVTQSFPIKDKKPDKTKLGPASAECHCFVTFAKVEVKATGTTVDEIIEPSNPPTYYKTKLGSKATDEEKEKAKARGRWFFRRENDGSISYVWVSFE